MRLKSKIFFRKTLTACVSFLLIFSMISPALALREPTLQDPSQDRKDANEEALSILRQEPAAYPGVNSDLIAGDLKKPTILANVASGRSLGNSSENISSVMTTSYLIPPLTPFFKIDGKDPIINIKGKEIFRIDFSETANGKLKFATVDKELDPEIRRIFLNAKIQFSDRIEIVRQAIKVLGQQYSARFINKLIVSFVADPETPLVLKVDENGKRVIQADYQLLFQPNVLILGILEVILGELLMPMANYHEKEVKIYLLHLYAKKYLNTDFPEEERQWITEAFRRGEYYFILNCFKHFSMGQKIGRSTTGELDILTAASEIFGQRQGNKEAVNPDIYNSVARQVLNWLHIYELEGKLERDDISDTDVKTYREDDLRQAVVHFAKAKRYELIPKLVEKFPRKEKFDVVVDVYHGMGFNPRTGLEITAEQVAQALQQLRNLGFESLNYLDISVSLDDFVHNLPTSHYEAVRDVCRFTPAVQMKLDAVRILYERLRTEASSLGASALKGTNTRLQTLVFQTADKEFSDEFLAHLLRSVENVSQKRELVLLALDSKKARKLKNRLLRLAQTYRIDRSIVDRIPCRFQYHTLQAKREQAGLKSFVEGLKNQNTDVVLVADYNTLNAVDSKTVLSLARDCAVEAGTSRRVFFEDVDGQLKANSDWALIDLSWDLLAQGDVSGLRDKLALDSKTGVFLARLDYLNQWLGRLAEMIAAEKNLAHSA